MAAAADTTRDRPNHNRRGYVFLSDVGPGSPASSSSSPPVGPGTAPPTPSGAWSARPGWFPADLAPGPGDLLIAADGGARLAAELGLPPQVVVGDFDSLSPQEAERLCPPPCRRIQHARAKDQTDAQLAAEEALAAGVSELVFVGGLGGRLDHELANLLLMASLAERGCPARLVSRYGSAYTVGPGGVRIPGRPGAYISLVPLSPVVEGVTTEGLLYPLRDEPLTFGDTRGVSNRFLGATARVWARSGLLVAVCPAEG